MAHQVILHVYALAMSPYGPTTASEVNLDLVEVMDGSLRHGPTTLTFTGATDSDGGEYIKVAESIDDILAMAPGVFVKLPAFRRVGADDTSPRWVNPDRAWVITETAGVSTLTFGRLKQPPLDYIKVNATIAQIRQLQAAARGAQPVAPEAPVSQL